MNDIKPIETRYKGYRFRSRLEARWAVFFDALGVKWEYEPEGMDLTQKYEDICKRGWEDSPPLQKGERLLYLPDFYLPEIKRYVEIKPYGGPNWWGHGRMYETVCVCLNGMIVHGAPGTIEEKTYEICVSGDVDHWFGCCPKCGAFNEGYCSWAERICPNPAACGHNNKTWLDATLPMIKAITAARSARFEHGETPMVGHRS